MNKGWTTTPIRLGQGSYIQGKGGIGRARVRDQKNRQKGKVYFSMKTRKGGGRGRAYK